MYKDTWMTWDIIQMLSKATFPFQTHLIFHKYFRKCCMKIISPSDFFYLPILINKFRFNWIFCHISKIASTFLILRLIVNKFSILYYTVLVPQTDTRSKIQVNSRYYFLSNWSYVLILKIYSQCSIRSALQKVP